MQHLEWYLPFSLSCDLIVLAESILFFFDFWTLFSTLGRIPWMGRRGSGRRMASSYTGQQTQKYDIHPSFKRDPNPWFRYQSGKDPQPRLQDHLWMVFWNQVTGCLLAHSLRFIIHNPNITLRITYTVEKCQQIIYKVLTFQIVPYNMPIACWSLTLANYMLWGLSRKAGIQLVKETLQL